MALQPPNTIRQIGGLEFDTRTLYNGDYAGFFNLYDSYVQKLHDMPNRAHVFASLIRMFQDLKVPVEQVYIHCKKRMYVMEFANTYVIDFLTRSSDLTAYLKLVLCVNRSGIDGYPAIRLLEAYVQRYGRKKISDMTHTLAGVPMDYYQPKYSELLFE